MRKTLRSALAALALVAMAAPAVAAENWPERPIRVMVPFAPGGTVDVVARFLAERLGGDLGQPLVVENRPGAGGNIGTEAVTRADADGHTLLVAGSPTHVMNPLLYKLTYDPIEALTQIALIGTSPNLLVVNPSLGVDSVQALVELARQKPGMLAYSSAGRGTTGHLAGELLGRLADVDVRHVAYKGQADAITGVIRGDVAFAFVTIPGTLAQVEAGRLNAIAITSAQRSELAPDVPSVAEAGYPDFEVLAWYNLSAPAGLAPAISARLVQALEKIMAQQETRERFAALGVEPRLLSGDAYLAFMRQESATWGPLIQAAGLGAE